jgi:O-antigen ligase
MSTGVLTSSTRRGDAGRPDLVRLPAVVFVIGYCGLLFLVPSQLIIRQLGAPGTPANLWALAALTWWVCATVGGMNPGRQLSPIRVAVLVLVIAVLASYVASSASGWTSPADVRQTTDELWTLVPGPVPDLNEKMTLAANRGLLALFGWVGIALLTTDGLRSWRDLHLLITWMVWLGAIVAAIGVVQFFTTVNIADWFIIPGLSANSEFGTVATRSILRRVSGTAVHPIEFGVVLAALFPLALHRTIFNSRAARAWVPTVIIGVAIPMSVSRSAILAMGVTLVVLFLGWPNRWRVRALFIAPAAAVALRLLIPGLLGTIQSLFLNLFNDPSISGRTDDYAVIFRIYGEHEVLGRGLFTFVPRYYRILDNQFLMLLLELGLIGALCALLVFVVGFYCARAARRYTADPANRNLALALSASIAGIVLSYATFDAWSFPMAAGTTFLLIGAAGAAWQVAVREREDHRSRPRSRDGASEGKAADRG